MFEVSRNFIFRRIEVDNEMDLEEEVKAVINCVFIQSFLQRRKKRKPKNIKRRKRKRSIRIKRRVDGTKQKNLKQFPKIFPQCKNYIT